MLMEDNELAIFLYLVVIVLLILYLIGFIIRATMDDYPTKCEYREPSDFNNGDIVCVAYSTISAGFVSSFSGSMWTHTGTIYVDPKTNIRYVLEGAIYRQQKYKNFFKIPLETWLHINRKFIIGYKKYNGPHIDSDYLWSKFEWMTKKCKLEAFNIFWSRFLVNKDYYEYSRNKKYTCLEATVILGQDVGIFEKDKIYCSYFPGDIVNNRISLCKGISYDLPIQIALHPTREFLISNDKLFFKIFWEN